MQTLTLRQELSQKLTEIGADTFLRGACIAGETPHGETIGDGPGGVAHLGVGVHPHVSDARRELEGRACDVAYRARTCAAARENDTCRQGAPAIKRAEVLIYKSEDGAETRGDEILYFLARIHLAGESAELHTLGFFERDAEAERDV